MTGRDVFLLLGTATAAGAVATRHLAPFLRSVRGRRMRRLVALVGRLLYDDRCRAAAPDPSPSSIRS